TTADLAKRLGLTAGWVRGLIRDGKIPAVQIPPTRKGDPGTTWRIYPGFSRSLDVEAFQRKTRKTPARPLVETKKSRHAIETQTIEEFSEDAKEMERQRLELIGRIIAYSKRANAERLEEFTRRGVAGLKPKQMEAEEAVSIRVAKSIVGLSRHETLEQKCKQGKIPGARRKGKSMYWEIPVAWVNEQYRLGQTHLSAKEFLMACEQVGIPITRDTYYRRIALHGTRHISYEMLFSFEYFVKLLTLWNEEQRARRSGLTLRQLALRAGVHRITVRQIVGKNHFKTARVRTLAGTEMIIIPHPECRRLLNGLREEKYGAARAARRIEEKLDRQNVQRDVYAAVEKLGIGKRSFRGRLLVAPEHYPEVLRQLQRWEKQRKNYLPRRHARKQFALIVNGLQIPPEETQALLQLNYKGANDEQAEKLWILARQGNDRAFEIIAQGFMPFIRYVAYQYYRHIPLGDKRQFGLWGLLQAVSHWGALPEGNKAQTNGYARAYIRGAVLRECRKELLPRGKASFSLLSAMELGIELPERKEPGLEIAPGINFIPWQLSE
ncbi:MAG TPA: hypothetical protein VJH24_04840, partial [Candidatus Bilamarchaeaceae archaeon]|nr:hypothetical protein [Candidatus Bilamarchaeaceae archaeon]